MGKVWKRKGYVIKKELEEMGGGLSIYKIEGPGVVQILYPYDYKDMIDIERELDSGTDVDGWSDGNGGLIDLKTVRVEGKE